MSSRHTIGQKGAVGEQDENELDTAVIDEVAEREAALRPGVEQEVQATVDYADDREFEGRLFGQTLEAEERMRAREWEIERTRLRWDRGQDSEREARCRLAADSGSQERRVAFSKRAASVDPWADLEGVDAREQLSAAELSVVNREAARMAARLGGFSTAAVSRLVARRVVDGMAVTEAVMTTMDEFRTAPGQVVPIGSVGEVDRREVDIEGRVTTLWEPSHPAIRQVGLIEDDSGRIKFTAWRKSRVGMVREGEHVRFRNVAKSWYRGRVSVALTGWSNVVHLEG